MDEDLKVPGSESDSDTESSESSESTDAEVDDLQDDCEKIGDIFDTIKKTLNEGEIDLTNSNGLKKFRDTYKDSLGKLTSGRTHHKQTLLHVLVTDATDEAFERYKPLVKLIIEEYPSILKELDDSSKTSLYKAIGLKCNKLVEYICDTYTDINSVLEQPCTPEKKTCIHAAIHEGMNIESTIKLITNASERVLCMQDYQGNTALHSAVKYELCSEEQLQIVQTLAEGDGSQAMKKRNDDSFSPYLYHMDTRKKAIEAIVDAADKTSSEKTIHATQGKRLNSNFASLDGGKIAHMADLKGLLPHAASSGHRKHPSGEPYSKSSMVRRPSTTVQMLPLSFEKPSLAYSKSEGSESAVRSPLEPGQSPNDNVDKDPNIENPELKETKKSTASKKGNKTETGEKKEKRKKKEKGKKTEKGRDLKKGADAVENFLMLHCMRTLDKTEAEEFLYGKTQGVSTTNTMLFGVLCILVTNSDMCYT